MSSFLARADLELRSEQITGVEPLYANENLLERVKQEVDQSLGSSADAKDTAANASSKEAADSKAGASAAEAEKPASSSTSTTGTASTAAAKKPLSHWDAVELPNRRKAAALFAADFARGRSEQPPRYLTGALPKLDQLASGSFDAIVSGFFLFVYADKSRGGIMSDSPFDEQFHLDSVRELVRVCAPGGCVSIYPVYSWPPFKPRTHPLLEPVMKFVRDKLGCTVELVTSSYWSCYDDLSWKTKPDYPNAVLRLHKPKTIETTSSDSARRIQTK